MVTEKGKRKEGRKGGWRHLAVQSTKLQVRIRSGWCLVPFSGNDFYINCFILCK